MNNRRFRTVDLTMGAIFVVLMMIGANLAYWVPALKITYAGGEVPITLQTFFAILAGILLGRKLGAFSMIVYLAVGIVGVPVYAEMKAGIAQFTLPTGGFLISFVVVAYLAGLIVEKASTNNLATYSVAVFSGLLVNYLIGTPYLFLSMNYVLEVPISMYGSVLTMLPFFIKDAVITGLLVVSLPSFVKRIQRVSPSLRNH